MKTTVIGRNSFARIDIIRLEVKPANGENCDWCGGLNKRGNLFRYGESPDGIIDRSYLDYRKFCCKQCFLDYNGE